MEAAADDSDDDGLLESVALRPCLGEPEAVLRALHEAIFPIAFDDAFYQRLAAGGYSAIGAYAQGGLGTPGGVAEVLVGIAVWEVGDVRHAVRQDGRLFTRLAPLAPAADQRVLYILTLGVHPRARGRGLGGALLQHCVAQAHALAQCACVYLHVLRGNVPAVRMYERARFVRVRTLRAYYAGSSFVAPPTPPGGVAAHALAPPRRAAEDADAHVYARYFGARGAPPLGAALIGSLRTASALVADAAPLRGGDAAGRRRASCAAAPCPPCGGARPRARWRRAQQRAKILTWPGDADSAGEGYAASERVPAPAYY